MRIASAPPRCAKTIGVRPNGLRLGNLDGIMTSCAKLIYRGGADHRHGEEDTSLMITRQKPAGGAMGRASRPAQWSAKASLGLMTWSETGNPSSWSPTGKAVAQKPETLASRV